MSTIGRPISDQGLVSSAAIEALLLEGAEKTVNIEQLYKITKLLFEDLTSIKNSIYGLRRRDSDNMLLLYNNPTKRVDNDIEVMRMDGTTGQFAFNTQYPDWLRSHIDVNGRLHAIPPYSYYRSSAQAGAGLYTWATIVKEDVLYTARQGTDTQIRILCPGEYRISCIAVAETDGSGNVEVHVLKNAVAINGLYKFDGLTAGSTVYTGSALVHTLAVGDLITVQLITGAARGVNSHLQIEKVN